MDYLLGIGMPGARKNKTRLRIRAGGFICKTSVSASVTSINGTLQPLRASARQRFHGTFSQIKKQRQAKRHANRENSGSRQPKNIR
jgi:hypothetical protein